MVSRYRLPTFEIKSISICIKGPRSCLKTSSIIGNSVGISNSLSFSICFFCSLPVPIPLNLVTCYHFHEDLAHSQFPADWIKLLPELRQHLLFRPEWRNAPAIIKFSGDNLRDTFPPHCITGVDLLSSKDVSAYPSQ